MITISLCMIVKNEEQVLARCLDSIAALMDEIIIVDTGSTDNTKEIARKYTDKIYDFVWCDDFSAARNFSFSKATMDYIYAPDADEYLDPENRLRFSQIKELLLPEIEIVQMYYLTPAEHNTVQNASRELRPKLFKRLRQFTWIDPIHETVRLDPVVYDSDIEILHLPVSGHEKRDFSIFAKSYARDGRLSGRIIQMYAKELLKCGTPEDFSDAAPLFLQQYAQNVQSASACVLARYYRLIQDRDAFFGVALKNVAKEGCSEICYELGEYYKQQGNYEEAVLWYYNAAFETNPILDVETGGRRPLLSLAECYDMLADQMLKQILPDSSDTISQITEFRQIAADYRTQAEHWELPQELDL